MDEWSGLLGIVVGAVLGGAFALLGAHLASRNQRREEIRRLKLAKLEELHALIGNYRCRREQVEMTRSILDGVLEEEKTERDPLPAAHTAMLVGIYAPELGESLERLENMHEKFIIAYLEVMKQENGSSSSRAELLGLAESISLGLEAACDDFQVRTVQLARTTINEAT